MEYSVAFQCSVLLRSLVLGILLAAAYDVFRLLRGTGKGLAALLLDALYGLVFCAAIFVFVVCVLQTEFRLWQIAWTAIGMAIWFWLAGRWFRCLLRMIASGLYWIMAVPVRFIGLILCPLRRIGSMLPCCERKKQKNLSKDTFHFRSNRLK